MTHHPYTRSQRVGETLKKVVGEIIYRLKDPRIGLVSVTRVDVSPDLRKAKVYVSIYADKQGKEESIKGLEHAKGFIRREIGKEIRLKFLPEISFFIDSSIEEDFRLKKIFDSIFQRQEPPA